jgi:hypothetical protein
MAAPKTYQGGCHCRRVRYEVTTDLAPVISCNCSICTRHGFLWTFVMPAQFSLKAGDNEMAAYQFNKHVIHHRFCPVCGVESFARGTRPDGAESIAINVRGLDGIDLAGLKLTPFEGRSL